MSDKLSVERLREFISRAERADNIVVAYERFRAERFLWNNRAAILAMAEDATRMREALGKISAFKAGVAKLDPADRMYCQGYNQAGTYAAEIARHTLEEISS